MKLKIDTNKILTEINKNYDTFYGIVKNTNNVTKDNLIDTFKSVVKQIPSELKMQPDEYLIKQFIDFHSPEYIAAIGNCFNTTIISYLIVSAADGFSLYWYKVNKKLEMSINITVRQKPSVLIPTDIQISFAIYEDTYRFNNTTCLLSELKDKLEFIFGNIESEVTFTSGNLICGNRFGNIDDVEEKYSNDYNICYNGGMKNTAGYLGKKGIAYIQTSNTSVFIIAKGNDIKIIEQYCDDNEFADGDNGYSIVANISCDVWRVELVDKEMIPTNIEDRFVDCYEKETFEFKVGPGTYKLKMNTTGRKFMGHYLYGTLVKK